jgi:hypothetical protein
MEDGRRIGRREGTRDRGRRRERKGNGIGRAALNASRGHNTALQRKPHPSIRNAKALSGSGLSGARRGPQHSERKTLPRARSRSRSRPSPRRSVCCPRRCALSGGGGGGGGAGGDGSGKPNVTMGAMQCLIALDST